MDLTVMLKVLQK